MNYTYSFGREVKATVYDRPMTYHEAFTLIFKNYNKVSGSSFVSPTTLYTLWKSYIGQWDNLSSVTDRGAWQDFALLESTSDTPESADYDDSVAVAHVSITVHNTDASVDEVLKFSMVVNRNTCASEIRNRAQAILGTSYYASACELTSVCFIVDGTGTASLTRGGETETASERGTKQEMKQVAEVPVEESEVQRDA